MMVNIRTRAFIGANLNLLEKVTFYYGKNKNDKGIAIAQNNWL